MIGSIREKNQFRVFLRRANVVRNQVKVCVASIRTKSTVGVTSYNVASVPLIAGTKSGARIAEGTAVCPFIAKKPVHNLKLSTTRWLTRSRDSPL